MYHKSTRDYSLGSRPISYTSARELLLNCLVELGFPRSCYGLHSLRSGGASAAANACLNDMVDGSLIMPRTVMSRTTLILFFQFLVRL